MPKFAGSLAHMTAEVRAALRTLPPVGEVGQCPLGPGLLASGQLGIVIRDLQDGPAQDGLTKKSPGLREAYPEHARLAPKSPGSARSKLRGPRTDASRRHLCDRRRTRIRTMLYPAPVRHVARTRYRASINIDASAVVRLSPEPEATASRRCRRGFVVMELLPCPPPQISDR